MILPPEASTSTSFQSLHEAGASYAGKIVGELGLDWGTVRSI